MAKPLAKVQKSYQDGHVALRVTASASRRGQDASASVAVDLPLETARQLHADLGAAIEKEAAKVQAHLEREARRKAWRDREVAAGRMKIISWSNP
jgi:ribosome-associated translation inhibitor RaiA